MYVLDGGTWDECEPNPLVLGAGYRLAVGWNYELVTFFGIVDELAPIADPEGIGMLDDNHRIVWSVSEPLHLLTVDELESELDVELPKNLRAALARDQREHYAGEAGESVEELGRRIRELAQQGKERRETLERAGARWNRWGELELDGEPLGDP